MAQGFATENWIAFQMRLWRRNTQSYNIRTPTFAQMEVDLALWATMQADPHSLSREQREIAVTALHTILTAGPVLDPTDHVKLLLVLHPTLTRPPKIVWDAVRVRQNIDEGKSDASSIASLIVRRCLLAHSCYRDWSDLPNDR